MMKLLIVKESSYVSQQIYLTKKEVRTCLTVAYQRKANPIR